MRVPDHQRLRIMQIAARLHAVLSAEGRALQAHEQVQLGYALLDASGLSQEACNVVHAAWYQLLPPPLDEPVRPPTSIAPTRPVEQFIDFFVADLPGWERPDLQAIFDSEAA